MLRAKNLRYVTGRLMCGPGADRKYRSEEEVREEAKSRQDTRRRRLLGGGLAAGILLGASWGYAAAKRKAANLQIRYRYDGNVSGLRIQSLNCTLAIKAEMWIRIRVDHSFCFLDLDPRMFCLLQ